MSTIFSEEFRNELQEIVTTSVKSAISQSTMGKPTANLDRLLETKDVSEYLGLTRASIEKLVKDKKLIPIEIGERSKRFRLSEIETYLESNRRAS